MLTPSQILRLMHINIVLARHGLDEVVLAIHLFRPIRFVLYLLPWHWFRRNNISHAVRIRRALEDLGPIFVKFGQMLSTRRDLLPDDIADELARLQDSVPPFPGEQGTRQGKAGPSAAIRAPGDSSDPWRDTTSGRPET